MFNQADGRLLLLGRQQTSGWESRQREKAGLNVSWLWPRRRRSPQTPVRTDVVTQARTASPLAARLSTARPVILRLKEFAVDYVFWAEAGGFGEERPGHFEDLPKQQPRAPRSRGIRLDAHVHAHTRTHTET